MAFFGKHVRLVCVAPGQIAEPFLSSSIVYITCYFSGPIVSERVESPPGSIVIVSCC
jgi:hypothetical protein